MALTALLKHLLKRYKKIKTTFTKSENEKNIYRLQERIVGCASG